MTEGSPAAGTGQREGGKGDAAVASTSGQGILAWGQAYVFGTQFSTVAALLQQVCCGTVVQVGASLGRPLAAEGWVRTVGRP